MTKDEIVYVSFFYSLLVAALIDRYYVIDRHKGKYGATVGIIALLCLCGSEVLYPLMNILVNTAIIYFSWKRWSGLFAFSFTSAYLFYFRYFCSASSITNMFMMSTTLKMISVAIDSSMVENVPNHDETGFHELYELTPKHITYYAMHYNGLVGVPFYTYKTYSDYITLPFKHHPWEWKYNSLVCLIDSLIIILGRQLLIYYWPLSYVLTDEFHKERSIFYRIWFIYPVGFDFLLRIYNAFVLTSASCYISGFGPYPEFTKPKCGHGPTESLEKMSVPRECLHNFELSYETIDNANLEELHFSIEFKKSVKYWNRTIQFWLYKYVHKMVPYNILKKPATMFFSCYWHGLQFGNLFPWVIATLALYIEERWEKILRGRKFSSFERFLRIALKLQILYNIFVTFVSQEWSIIVKYQTSVYWNHVVILFLLLLSSFLVRRTTP